MRLLLVSLAMLLASLPCRPQVLEQLVDGPAPGALFGDRVVAAGDLDDDGHADLLVRFRTEAGWQIRAISGADGTPFFDIDPAPHSGTLDFGLGLDGGGDVNGDGVPDILVGDDALDVAAPDAGAVFVFSGVDGSLLDTVQGAAADHLGNDVTFLGDLDGDGADDWAAWAAQFDLPFPPSPDTEVRVYSGATSTLLAVVDGSGTPFGSAREIAGVDDLDGDGLRELAVSLTGQDFTPRIRVTTGASLAAGMPALLWESLLDTEVVYDISVARLGDTDGDGVSDVLALASPLGDGVIGDAHVLSGVDGHELQRLHGTLSLGERFARSGAGLGDVDGDGRNDVAVGAGAGWDSENRGAYVRVFSGHTGAELLTLWSGSADPDAFDGVENSVAAPGDVSGDGQVDLAFGATSGNSTASGPTGRLYVFGFEGDWTWKGWSKPGAHGEPWLLATGALEPGSPITLRMGAAAPASPLVLVVGAPQASLPFKGGTLGPTPDLLLVDQTDATGARTWAGTWDEGAPLGTTFLVQVWIDEGDGEWSATNTLRGQVP